MYSKKVIVNLYGFGVFRATKKNRLKTSEYKGLDDIE